MSRHSRIPTALIPALVLLILAASWASLAHAADPGGLQGTDLNPSTGVADLLRQLLSQNKGKIEGVHVVEDRAESLTVQIAYSGLESGDLVMSAAAEDNKHRRINGIAEAKTTLTSTEGEVTLKLELAPGVPGGTKLDQSFLLVQIGKEGTVKKSVIKSFQCANKWEKAVPPEELKITVVAEPIGKSKALPATKTILVGTLSPRIFTAIKIPPPKPAEPSRPVVQAIPKTTPATPMRHPVVIATEAAPSAPRPPSGVSTGAVTQPAIATFTPNLAVLRAPNLVVGLPSDVKKNEGRGPSANAIRLFDTLVSDVGLTAEDVVDLHPNIYEDANPDSGYFYYLPRGYYLYWDEDSGYALRMLYGASTDESNVNTVSVAARLTSGIDVTDITLVRNLLQKYCGSTGQKFRELKPFPFSDMSVSLKSDLGQYSIPAERISVAGITDIAGMIDLSLTTDPVTKENLQMVLTQGLGISGTVTYQSASDSGGGSLQVTVPILIKFGDRHSFGTRTFARGTKLKNTALYPVKLKRVDVLMGEATPTVYSYDLGDTSLPGSASATIDSAKIPSWLDSSAIKMWVDYGVVSDEEATAKALETVTGGVTSIAHGEITFRTLSPLADTGVALIVATVSSKYFDPRASGETTKTVELTQDGTAYKVGPIYLIDRQDGQEKPGDPLFKFKLTAVKADGTTKEAAEWTESNRLSVYIGSAQLRPIVGEESPGEI